MTSQTRFGSWTCGGPCGSRPSSSPSSGPACSTCGNGSLARCRAALETSLAAAVAETPDQVYPAEGPCQAGDQACHDAIQFRAIGAITQPLMEWVNRPTFQQAVEIPGHQGG